MGFHFVADLSPDIFLQQLNYYHTLKQVGK